MRAGAYDYQSGTHSHRETPMRDASEQASMLSDVNAEFLEHLYNQWQDDPDSLDPSWRTFFDGLSNGAG
ncbi:MAG TPA: hypothetical protein VLB09_01475, partial [Nitrospiria bacterium]|nr:hypothetical protein [Nitrospiria bacterium]